MRIYLTGFMGCGKSTVGPELARRLGVPFLDLDEEIERQAGCAVAEIFAAEQEAGFRRRERQALRATTELSAAVVATGGGCPVDPRNRQWMRQHGRTIWLHLPWPALASRLAAAPGPRPLWSSPAEAEALYQRRLPAYQDCDLEIALRSEDRPEEVAARIFALLGAEPDPVRPRPM